MSEDKMLSFRTYHLDHEAHPAGWGARTILSNGHIDIVPDRVDSFGSAPDKARLFAHLNEYLTREYLNAMAGSLRPSDDTATVILDDDVVKVVASPQASYGYVYITGVLKA